MTQPQKHTPNASTPLIHALLLGVQEARDATGMTFDGDAESPRSMMYDYGRNVGDLMNDEQRAYVIDAVNSRDALVETLKHALPYMKHSLKFYRYQKAGNEFWPNREEAEANIDEVCAALKLAGAL